MRYVRFAELIHPVPFDTHLSVFPIVQPLIVTILLLRDSVCVCARAHVHVR